MKLAEIPLEIALSKCLLVSGEYGCSKEMAIIASLLSLRSVWAAPRGQPKALERAKDKFAVCYWEWSLCSANLVPWACVFSRINQSCNQYDRNMQCHDTDFNCDCNPIHLC